MNKAKVLITGCAGLMGANFSRYLLDKGYDVVGIDDLSAGYIENIDKRTQFYIFNLLDLKTLERIFCSENCKCVHKCYLRQIKNYPGICAWRGV